MPLPVGLLMGALGSAGKLLKGKKKPQVSGKEVAQKITGRKSAAVDKGQNQPIDFDSPVASSAAKISESTGSSTAMTAEEVALEIHTKTIKIRNLLKGSLVLDKMQEKGKHKAIEKAKRTGTEDKIEKGAAKGKFGLKIPTPRIVKSLWERLKDFFITILWGWIAVRLVDKTKLLQEWLPKIGAAVDWVIDVGIGFIDAIGTGLKAAYDAYDWTRENIVKIFGGKTQAEQEQFAAKFDDFMGKANKVMNLVIALGLAAAAMAMSGRRPPGRPPRNRPPRGPRNRLRRVNRRIRRFTRPNRPALDRLRKLRLRDAARKAAEAARRRARFFRRIRPTNIRRVGQTVLGRASGVVQGGLRRTKEIASTARRIGTPIVQQGLQTAKRVGTPIIQGGLQRTKEIASTAKRVGTPIVQRGLQTARNIVTPTPSVAGVTPKPPVKPSGGWLSRLNRNISSGWSATVSTTKRLGTGAWNLTKELGTAAIKQLDSFGKSFQSVADNVVQGVMAKGKQWATSVGDIVEMVKSPGKLVAKVKEVLKGPMDEMMKNNKFIKQLTELVKDPKKAKDAIQSLFKSAQKSDGLLKLREGLQAAKKSTKGIGGVDKVIAAILGLLDYGVFGESPVNAILKAIGALVGYSAGFAIGAPFGGVPGFITGMAGGWVGEKAADLISGVLAQTPGIKDLDDPIANALGLTPRKLVRDPSAPLELTEDQKAHLNAELGGLDGPLEARTLTGDNTTETSDKPDTTNNTNNTDTSVTPSLSTSSATSSTSTPVTPSLPTGTIPTAHMGGIIPRDMLARLQGSEIVIDSDSAGPAKDMLLAINQANSYEGIVNAIRKFAPYEAIGSETITIPAPQRASQSGNNDSRPKGFVAVPFLASSAGKDPFEILYKG